MIEIIIYQCFIHVVCVYSTSVPFLISVLHICVCV